MSYAHPAGNELTIKPTRGIGSLAVPSVYPEYFIGTDYYLPIALKDKVKSMSDSDGYVRGGIQRYVGND